MAVSFEAATVQPQRASVLLGVSALVVACGCGQGSHELETAPVTGRVVMNGEPVTSGYIYTSPRRGRLATGKIDAGGTFSLGTYGKSDGAVIGEHAVMLAPIPRDEAPTPEGAIVPPKKYASASTSGIVIDVPPEGLTDFVIELQPDPNAQRAAPRGPQPIE